MNQAQISVFHGAGQPMEMLQIEIPELKIDEILVRNLYTTICGSDLHTFCGLRSEKVPTVLGHEIVGEIVAFSETHGKFDHLGNPLKIGDRVTWSIFASDASSLMSMFGMPQKASGLFKYGHTQITDGDALHGGLATHCVIKNGTAIIKLSEKIPLKVAATINCSIATVAGALRLAGNVNNKRVFITGSGLLGIVCAAMCRSKGAASVFMGDINPERLKKSLEFGVDATYLLADQHELPEAIDIAFDMSGSTDAMEQGLASLAIGGTAVWIGAVFKSRPVQVDAEQIVRRIISIKGLHNYNYEDFVAAVDFITAHHETYPFDSIVSKEFDLENSEVAMKYAVEKKPFRVGINMEKSESDGK